jgi:hypothetical protein
MMSDWRYQNDGVDVATFETLGIKATIRYQCDDSGLTGYSISVSNGEWAMRDSLREAERYAEKEIARQLRDALRDVEV